MSAVTEYMGLLSAAQGALTATNAEIQKCQELIAALKKVSTKIDYVLKSHDNIKSTYHLAGTPYLEMTTDEKDIVKKAKKAFKGKKEDVLGQLETKLGQLETTAQMQSLTVSSLQVKLQAAQAQERAEAAKKK